MEGKKDALRPVITREESRFIEDNIDPEKTRALFVEGILLRLRRGGQTLDEILKETLEIDEEGPDQSGLWKEAHNFVKENREYFNLEEED